MSREVSDNLALWGVPLLSQKLWDVIQAADAYIDQLNSFNDLHHPEVVKARKELSKAVAKRHKGRRHP